MAHCSRKVIFIRMPKEEVLPPFSFIALHNATKLFMVENSEVFMSRVGSGGWYS
jgi:hypothetical protein